MRKSILKCLLAIALCVVAGGSAVAAVCSAAVSNVAWRAHGESDPVTGALPLDYVPDGNGRAVVCIGGRTVVDSATAGTYTWQPQTNGTHTVAHSGWGGAFTAKYVVRVPSTVSNVAVCQRWPWNGLVDIDYTITGGEENAQLAVRVRDGDTGRTYVPANFLGGVTPPTAAGRHRITWDTAADELDLISSNLTMTVSIVTADYCVIDLSGGANATNYPVSYLADAPTGGWPDEYKTTKLVLRRVEAGSFIMGDDQTDESHRVTLTKPFYVGVFEVTQKQWKLVMGSNPSDQRGDSHPVEKVSYYNIRGSSVGANWPSSSDVDATSFIGRLRTRSGLAGVDLPTESQWEYACRAGKTSKYNNGGNDTEDLSMLGRWNSKGLDFGSHDHVKVGTYEPNAWGIYDMHGNVAEWCLDRYGNAIGGNDPKGAATGDNRVFRGGSFYSNADACRSGYRDKKDPSNSAGFSTFGDNGFRLCCPSGQ